MSSKNNVVAKPAGNVDQKGQLTIGHTDFSISPVDVIYYKYYGWGRDDDSGDIIGNYTGNKTLRNPTTVRQ